MGNDKTIEELSCKLIKKRITKKRKIVLEIIDSNAKCKIAILSDGSIANDGILEASKPVELFQKETIKIEYELEFKKPFGQKQDILKFPITIIRSSLVEGKTIAQFIFANVLEKKKQCILVEFRIAEVMSEIGICELLNVQRSFYDYVYLPLLLLSWSFERLLKCLLNLIVIDDKGKIDPIPYPEKAKEGHNLELLVKNLLFTISDVKYSSLFVSVQQEIDYLKENKALNPIIKALSDFGMGARYYYVDIILRGTTEHRSPSNLWDNIENLIHSIIGKESPPAGSDQLEREMKQLTIEPLKEFRRILIKLIDITGQNKFSDFYKVDTNMTYIFDFNLNL